MAEDDIPETKAHQILDRFASTDEILREILKVLKKTIRTPEEPTIPGMRPFPAPTPPFPTAITAILEGYPFNTNQTNITTAGNPLSLVGKVRTRAILIKANLDNIGNIYIGDKGVSSTKSYILEPGGVVGGNIDASKTEVYIDGATAGDGVSFMVLL